MSLRPAWLKWTLDLRLNYMSPKTFQIKFVSSDLHCGSRGGFLWWGGGSKAVKLLPWGGNSTGTETCHMIETKAVGHVTVQVSTISMCRLALFLLSMSSEAECFQNMCTYNMYVAPLPCLFLLFHSFLLSFWSHWLFCQKSFLLGFGAFCCHCFCFLCLWRFCFALIVSLGFLSSQAQYSLLKLIEWVEWMSFNMMRRQDEVNKQIKQHLWSTKRPTEAAASLLDRTGVAKSVDLF